MQVRDASRSRAAILDAAERCFAERGYRATTMQEIGLAAGLSRGAPAYFFGSKEALYREVLRRVQADRDEAVAAAFAPLVDWAALPSREAEAAADLPGVLDAAVQGYWRFLDERPSFARLIAWESLGGHGVLTDAPAAPIAEALRRLHAVRRERGLGEFDPVIVSVLLVSLSFLPLAHEATFARSAIDTRAQDFRTAYRAEVLDALLHAVGWRSAPLQGRPAAPRRPRPGHGP